MKPKLNINEDFICRIWEGGKTYYNDPVTDSGEDVEVISYGTRNYDSGPDYRNAKVRIGSKVYNGDIEVHRDFKNWAEHSHPKDRRYNSVILHVVMWDSKERESPKLRIKRNLPSVILSNHLTASIHEIWQEIISNPSGKFRLPCYEKNYSADDTVILKMLHKTAAERLELKANRIKHRLLEFSDKNNELPRAKGIWEQVIYEFIFEALGFAKNKEQMMELSSAATLKLLSKFAGNDIVKLQAVLFGCAGLFFDVRAKDNYIDEVKSVWRTMETKLNVNQLQRSYWNFFGQRPQNFPTLRIAYGSQLIKRIIYGDLLKKLVKLFSMNNMAAAEIFSNLLELLKPQKDTYWNTHHDFGKHSKNENKLGGMQRITDIIINVIIPVIHLYGTAYNKKYIMENVASLYNNLNIKPDNRIIRIVQQQLLSGSKIKINTPALEQAVIQLHNFYCTRQKCDKCEIGKRVFENKGYDYKIIYY